MSRRLIGEATGIGKTAVGEYVRRAAVAGLSWPLPDEIDDAELERRLFPPTAAGSSAARTDPDWSHIHTQMKRRGVTLALLWQEYRGEHAQGYAYSWFCERYSDWRKRITPTMRQTHVAGEKLFVDWAGDAIAVFDPITGAEHGARIFVAALGASYAHIRIMCRSLAPRGVEGGSAGRDLTIIKGSGGTAAADRAVGIEAA
ncbi:MAG: hypothetical protein WAL02_13940 [Rhodoplanes sp.]